MSYEPVLIYMTTADLNEAERLGELLLQKRLVACVNLPQGGMISMFHWQDQLDHSKEQLMLAKSTRDHLPAIQQILKEHHSYECPCLLALPILGGNPSFLDWIKEETHSQKGLFGCIECNSTPMCGVFAQIHHSCGSS